MFFRALFFFLMTLLFWASAANAVTFGFDHHTEEWGLWGEGLGSHRSDVGNKRPGSIWLSTDYGENHTTHYHWSNLAPGYYRVTAFVRARNVQRGPEGVSFWHFYDGGEGTKSVFMDLFGSYEFRKVEYYLKVAKKDLSIWFRLKAPGQVWIDDISLTKASGPNNTISIAHAKPLKFSAKSSEPQMSGKKHVVLADFEDQEASFQPFREIVTNAKGNHFGQIKSRQYYNFNLGELQGGNWSSFDRLEIDVNNGTQDLYQLFLTLGDENSVNYWSQLNHKTHLAPGWNKISFDLRQYIGERGSHRYHRPLNLSKLKKMFIVVDPDGHGPVSGNFFIDNISLVSIPPPAVPAGVFAFDFTSHKSQGKTFFTKVTSQDLYDPSSGHGFIDPKFWRIEDSIYASENLRYSIGLLKGKFRVKIPNGEYKFSLIMDKLGIWDVPFWRNRKILNNGIPVFMESRSSAGEYIKDLLRFESVVPEEDDHPYDLYLSKIFRPIEGAINVTDGQFELEFVGDPSGISLNTLVIWRARDEKKVRTFLDKVKERDKLEFNWISRKVPVSTVADKSNAPALVAPELTLGPSGRRSPVAHEISLFGAAGERPFQLIQFPRAREISWTLSALKNENGMVLPEDAVSYNELIFQYTSPDLNHETYMVAGKYFRKLSTSKLNFPHEQTRYLSLQVAIKSHHSAGTYRGDLMLTNNGDKKTFPVSVVIMSHELPRIDFPVGFFGLDPIPYSYFKDLGIGPIRQKYRLKALKMISDSGFTTFTGLPSIMPNGSSGPMDLDTRELDELFTAASEYGFDQPVFTYGGQFPNELLDQESEFNGQLPELLNGLMKRRFWPKIVHTFSDEAGGYSDRIREDQEKGERLKKLYPFLALGGFSSASNSEAAALNRLFDYGFYSGSPKRAPSTGQHLGRYNASPGNLQDPRFTFGPGLFLARERGLSAYLEWHLVGFNNYPYYDLDGRESDVSMFMPTSEGDLLPALRFELATEGIQSFRKLVLLKELIRRKEGSTVHLKEADRWLSDLRSKNKYLEKDDFLRGNGEDFSRFHQELNNHLLMLTGAP